MRAALYGTIFALSVDPVFWLVSVSACVGRVPLPPCGVLSYVAGVFLRSLRGSALCCASGGAGRRLSFEQERPRANLGPTFEMLHLPSALPTSAAEALVKLLRIHIWPGAAANLASRGLQIPGLVVTGKFYRTISMPCSFVWISQMQSVTITLDR